MNNMENPVVKVEHLSHRYSVQWAIRDINFEICEKNIRVVGIGLEQVNRQRYEYHVWCVEPDRRGSVY